MSAKPGRIVRIMTFDDGGVASSELWYAAIDDDRQAVRAVSLAAATLADQGVSVEGVLSSTQVEAAGLLPGQVRQAGPGH